jgi:hypothetical protein
MANSFIAGLKIRTPDGFTVVEAEQIVPLLERYIPQCVIESATSEDNNSGKSAPTAENIGQLQNDVDSLENRITVLEDAEGDVTTLKEDVKTLQDGRPAGGVISGISGTSATVSLPSSDAWVVTATPFGGKLDDFYMSVAGATLTFHWSNSPSAGTAIHWTAHKESAFIS